MKTLIAMWVAGVLLTLALWVGAIVAVVHFAAKYW